jgi:hypothetical protein
MGIGCSSIAYTLVRTRIINKITLSLLVDSFEFVSIISFLSFLDRTNMANAKLLGIEYDIRLTPDEYRRLSIIRHTSHCLANPLIDVYRYFFLALSSLAYRQVSFFVNGNHRNGLLSSHFFGVDTYEHTRFTRHVISYCCLCFK